MSGNQNFLLQDGKSCFKLMDHIQITLTLVSPDGNSIVNVRLNTCLINGVKLWSPGFEPIRDLLYDQYIVYSQTTTQTTTEPKTICIPQLGEGET